MRISDWSSDVCSSDLAELDDAVRPILETKIRMGLFEHPYVDVAKAAAVLADPEHLRLARVAAERSAVLLRNDKQLLPLAQRKIKSIAVIGPLANAERDTLGPWVFPQNRPQAISVLAGLRAKVGRSAENTSELQSLMRISYAVL